MVVATGTIEAVRGVDAMKSSLNDGRWKFVVDARRSKITSNEFEENCASHYPQHLPQINTDLIDTMSFASLKTAIPSRESAGSFAPTHNHHQLQDVLAAIEVAGVSLRNSLGIKCPIATTILGETDIRGLNIGSDEVTAALAGQNHLSAASAYVTFSALLDPQMGPLSPEDQYGLICAGLLGEIAYLAAAQHEVGITAVGNFDAQWWGERVKSSSQGTAVIYMLALGTTQQYIKVDRIAPAGAHFGS
jgi:hypothetical protein